MKPDRVPLNFKEKPEKPKAKATPTERPQQIGARVSPAIYRRLKAHAALQGVTVAALVEQAITEFLENHRES